MNHEYLMSRADLVPLEDGRVVGHKFNDCSVSKETDGGEIFSVVSTASVDSYGDVIYQGPNENGSGWELDRYNRVPVLKWAHGGGIDFFGVPMMNLSDNGTHASLIENAEVADGSVVDVALALDVVRFDTDGDEECHALARSVDGKVRKNLLENSVGFVAGEEFREQRKDDDGKVIGVNFYQQSLMELSYCNRGANPDTKTVMRSMFNDNPELAASAMTRDVPDAEYIRKLIAEAVEPYQRRLKAFEDALMQYGDQNNAALDKAREAEADAHKVIVDGVSELLPLLKKFKA